MKYIKTYESLSQEKLSEFNDCIGKYVIFYLRYPEKTRGSGKKDLYLGRLDEISKSIDEKTLMINYDFNGFIYEAGRDNWFDVTSVKIDDLTFVYSSDSLTDAKKEYFDLKEIEKYNL